MEHILRKITEALSPIPCVRAVVLGGSRATHTQEAASDIDIGIYYDASSLDLDALNAAAKQLDDQHRSGLIGPPGSWGNWVNCGGWLTIGGMPVDLICRDLKRVEGCIEETERGEISMHYQPGHPHAYLNVMYRGELAVSKTLWAADSHFSLLKSRAKAYPDALANAMIGFFLFEAGFSRDHARKARETLDLFALSGHLFRAVSALNQVLFALNRTYCLNEKRAVARVDGMPLAPQKYKARIEALLSQPFSSDVPALLDQLIDDTQSLVDFAYR